MNGALSTDQSSSIIARLPDWLQRLLAGQQIPADLEQLRQTLAGGKLILVEGTGNIAAGGDIIDSTVITGGVTFIELTGAARQRMSALAHTGGLPPGSRLPAGDNPVFAGREVELEALAAALLSPPPGERVPAVVVTGPGGVGKTRLAVEFCCRHGPSFAGVHWVQCAPGDERRSVEAELVACGSKMDIQPWPIGLKDQVDLTLDEWNRPEARPRLVVIDGLERPDRLGHLLARLQGVRLLVTARALNWPTDLSPAQEQRLGPLSREESIHLLKRLAPSLADKPREDLDRLAAGSADLPSLLAGAAGVLGYAVITLSEYLEQIAGPPAGPRDPAVALRLLQWNALPDEASRLALVAAALFGGQYSLRRELLSLCLGFEAGRPADGGQYLEAALRPLFALRLAARRADGDLELETGVSGFVARQLPPGSLESALARIKTHLLNALKGSAGRAAAPRIAEGLLALPYSRVRWEAGALRTAVLRELLRLMRAAGAPVVSRRYAALLLTRLDWLRELPALPAGEALEYLELAGRFVETRRERLYLAEKVIQPFLELPTGRLADGPRARFLVFLAAMWMQLNRLPEAGEAYGFAQALLADLNQSGARTAEDDRTEARLWLGLGMLAIQQAFARAGLGEAGEPAAGLAQAEEDFELALQFARRYRQDPILEANIRMEQAYLISMQGEARRALEICASAAGDLEQRAVRARESDPEGYVVCKAHLLETTGMLHYDLGREQPRGSRQALAEYHAAYRQMLDELALLQAEGLRLTHDQVYPHFNAGDFLVPMFRAQKSPVPQPRQKALAHWQAGYDLALRLGLKGLARKLERRIHRYRLPEAELDAQGGS